MIQAYNHFLTEYSSNFSARTRSVHKPNELRAVYSRIQSMNRHSAYYKVNLTREKQLFTVSSSEEWAELITVGRSKAFPSSTRVSASASEASFKERVNSCFSLVRLTL